MDDYGQGAGDLGSTQRGLYLLGGALLVYQALRSRSFVARLAMAAAGAGLAWSAMQGQGVGSSLQRLGLDTSRLGLGRGSGSGAIRVSKSVVIDRPPGELYAFWRNFENLPRIMQHLEAVRVVDSRRSHWTARGPAGQNVSWEAEVTHDEQDREIAWRSLPGADVDNSGIVRFQPVGDGQSTQIRVEMRYTPPAGPLGAAIARLFGEEPNRQVEDDLQRFKDLMEGPAAPTVAGIAGQAAGTSTGAASQGGVHTM